MFLNDSLPIIYLKIVPFHEDYLTTSYSQAQDICGNEGARLWEPRNVDGFTSLKRFYEGQFSQTTFPEHYSSPIPFAIGILLKEIDDELVPIYPDGNPIPSQIVSEVVNWTNGNPTADDKLCVYIIDGEMAALTCDGPDKSGFIYYQHIINSHSKHMTIYFIQNHLTFHEAISVRQP